MTPDQFIKKWSASTLTERAASQSHFIDLCALLDEPTPTDADPAGEHYAFDRGATKTTGGKGWADVCTFESDPHPFPSATSSHSRASASTLAGRTPCRADLAPP